MNYLKLDLKICEGCGTLWIRMGGLSSVYCRGCAGSMAEYPAPRGMHAGGRQRLGHDEVGRPKWMETKAIRCSGAVQGGAR